MDSEELKTAGKIVLGLIAVIATIVLLLTLLVSDMTPEQKEVREKVYQMIREDKKISEDDANCLANRIARRVTMEDVASFSPAFEKAADDAAESCSNKPLPAYDDNKFFRMK